MRRLNLPATSVLAISAMVLAGCASDDPETDPAAVEETEATDEPEAVGGDGGVYWAAELQTACADYQAAATAATEPIFSSEGGPDPEVVRAVFVELTPSVIQIRDAAAAAEVSGELAADRDAWVTELDAQVAAFEAAGADAEVAMTTFQELRGPFTPAAGAAADAAGVFGCGTGNTFAQSELSAEALASAPRMSVSAVDYGFEVSGDFAAGDAVVGFSNDGGEEHEMILFRIAEGTSYEEAMAWIEENADSDEEPPFMQDFHGGFAGPGGRTEVAVTFTPGEWMMICFIPAADGTPHYAKGMHRQVTIA